MYINAIHQDVYTGKLFLKCPQIAFYTYNGDLWTYYREVFFEALRFKLKKILVHHVTRKKN